MEQKKHEAPNTFRHRKDGYCDTCYTEKQLAEEDETLPPLTPEEQKDVQRNKQALLEYFASRKPYREALGQTDFPDPFNVKAGPRKGASKTWRSRAKKPCGSEGAYQRHIKKNEDIDPACRAAHAVHAQEYRARKKLAS
ncbi:hypothetical protein ACLQ8T_05670 [Glutamicibacter sp. FR1]|uniref:hypothetical protein n=1 Tax=Glutamicibacter sp. FR1 TaxID=3393744 RepID=UPI0039B04C37